jgi:hypothetical protein
MVELLEKKLEDNDLLLEIYRDLVKIKYGSRISV